MYSNEHANEPDKAVTRWLNENTLRIYSEIFIFFSFFKKQASGNLKLAGIFIIQKNLNQLTGRQNEERRNASRSLWKLRGLTSGLRIRPRSKASHKSSLRHLQRQRQLLTERRPLDDSGRTFCCNVQLLPFGFEIGDENLIKEISDSSKMASFLENSKS